MKKEELIAGLLMLSLFIVLSAAWITNVIWMFHQHGFDIFLGFLGAVVAPIGVIHGIWLWF